jgi:hypothetical protein
MQIAAIQAALLHLEMAANPHFRNVELADAFGQQRKPSKMFPKAL